MGPNNAYEANQPSGGMSPGGNRHTQIPAARQNLDPHSDTQGVGFWTGKFSPKGKTAQHSEEADFAKLTSFQEHGASNEVVRYFEGVPKDDEETIKSLSSKRIFAMAKIAFRKGNLPLFALTKRELERRRMEKAMGYHAKVDHGAGRSAAAGRGHESMQVNRDKRVFEATHGVPANDEESTDQRTPTEDKHPVGAGSDTGDSPVGKALAADKARLDKGFLDDLSAQLKVAVKPKVTDVPTGAVTLAGPAKPRSHVGYVRTDPRTGKLQNIKQRGAPKPKEPAAPVGEPMWTSLENFGVDLSLTQYKPRGVKVLGKPNPMAEEMLYRCLRFISAETPPTETFLKNFTEDLQKYAQVTVAPDITALRVAAGFIQSKKGTWLASAGVAKLAADDKRNKKPKAKPPKGLSAEELKRWKFKQNPSGFILRDGKLEELASGLPPLMSGVFSGKPSNPNNGRFLPAPKYSDITLNCSPGKFPKGWEKKGGKVVTNPHSEYAMTVDYPQPRGARYVWLRVEGKTEDKWEDASLYGKHYDTILAGITRDLGSSDPATRRLAAALSVMDALHIRNGGSSDATGVVDLTDKNVWLNKSGGKTYLHYDFVAKADEPCNHTSMGPRPVTKLAEKALRELGIGDAPGKNGRKVFGVDPEDINAWLKAETGEPAISAHKVRHRWGTLYFKEKFKELMKQGKPADKKAAAEMFNAATYYAGNKLGHMLHDKKGQPRKEGATARQYYIDPAEMLRAMEWLGYDLSKKAEMSEKTGKKYFDEKRLAKLQKSLATVAGDEPVWVGRETPYGGHMETEYMGWDEEPVEKSDKPFHGYNPKRHARTGGLSAEGRRKMNRETGSHLQAPVTEKKPTGKRAARRRSFCARMGGMPGPTSKEGKLTPKGAALKRWRCKSEDAGLDTDLFLDLRKAVPVWEKPNPNKRSPPLSKKEKAKAKRWAKEHSGGKYPSLVANIAAKRAKKSEEPAVFLGLGLGGEVSKAKKPYGHVAYAYTKKTPSGLVYVQVKQKGAKPGKDKKTEVETPSTVSPAGAWAAHVQEPFARWTALEPFTKWDFRQACKRVFGNAHGYALAEELYSLRREYKKAAVGEYARLSGSKASLGKPNAAKTAQLLKKVLHNFGGGLPQGDDVSKEDYRLLSSVVNALTKDVSGSMYGYEKKHDVFQSKLGLVFSSFSALSSVEPQHKSEWAFNPEGPHTKTAAYKSAEVEVAGETYSLADVVDIFKNKVWAPTSFEKLKDDFDLSDAATKKLIGLLHEHGVLTSTAAPSKSRTYDKTYGSVKANYEKLRKAGADEAAATYGAHLLESWAGSSTSMMACKFRGFLAKLSGKPLNAELTALKHAHAADRERLEQLKDGYAGKPPPPVEVMERALAVMVKLSQKSLPKKVVLYRGVSYGQAKFIKKSGFKAVGVGVLSSWSRSARVASGFGGGMVFKIKVPREAVVVSHPALKLLGGEKECIIASSGAIKLTKANVYMDKTKGYY